MKNIFDRNSVWFGILIGLLLPSILFFILKKLVYYITLWTEPVLIQAYQKTFISDASVFLIAIFFNIIFFRKYLKNNDYELTGRGILVITTLLTFVFIAIKMNMLTQIIK